MMINEQVDVSVIIISAQLEIKNVNFNHFLYLVTKTVEEGDKDDHEEGVCANSGESRRDRHPFVFFENSEKKLFSVHKCVIADKKSDLTDSQLVSLVPTAASERLQWAVFMLGGGHFAGAVFRGAEPILHKTFHCYTVRAKQGGSQGASDNSRGHAKSAGASLRRYNEQALVQHVQVSSRVGPSHMVNW